MKRFSRALLIVCLIILILISVGCTDLYSSNWVIKSTDQTKTVGRVGYIEIKLTTQSGVPISDTQIKIMYKEDSQWESFKDPLTGKETFVTDKNGTVTVSVFSSKEITWQFNAYVVDNPSIKTEFTVRFVKPNWLFMVWMCADNNLENYGLNDLEEMKNANANVSVITFFDGRKNPDAIYVLDEFGEQKKIYTFDQDLNSGDPDKLLEWMGSIFGEYESSYRALILWDHGSAWVGDSKSLSATYTPKAICYDDTSGSSISVAELREVLEEYYENSGPRINLLGMDACLMGSIEVLYELKGLVDYVVASSFSVPGDGYDYSFLNQITSTDDTLDVGEKIVDAYRQYYDGNSSLESEGLSLAVYDMSKVESTTLYISLLGSRLFNIMNSSIRSTIHSFYQDLTVYYYLKDQNNVYYPVLVDLNDCAYLMELYINDSDVQNYAQQIQEYLEELVVYEYVEKTGRTISNPVSIFTPKNANIFNSYINDYSTLLFKNLKWDDFLQSWLN